MQAQKPRLAIIGTGIAGLSASWLLRDSYDITIFESADRAGMGAHTINYDVNGTTHRVDIPLRIFCKGYYDHLMALYEQVGVEIKPADHAGVFADADGKVLLHYGNQKIANTSAVYLKGRSLVDPQAWLLGIESQYFFKRVKRDLVKFDDLAEQTFEEYLERTLTSKRFVRKMLLPIMSVICTCDYQSVLNYPADVMLGYLSCGVAKWGILSAVKGVDDIVLRLLGDAQLKTGCPIAVVKPDKNQIRIIGKDGNSFQFDHVVIASQAQQAASMLNGYDRQIELLKAVPFETSEMSVHTDTSILPKTLVSTSPVNYHLIEDAPRAEVSVDLSKAFPHYAKQPSVFQTWNPLQKISKDKELARVKFTRPLVTHQSREAVRTLRQCQQEPENRLWFCGSYMVEKIPLLDAAVDSSVAVAQHLGVSIPWTLTG